MTTYMETTGTIHFNLNDKDITDLVNVYTMDINSLRQLIRKAVEEIAQEKDVFGLHDVLEILINKYNVKVPDLVKVNGRLHSNLVFKILREMVMYGELSDRIYYSYWSTKFVVIQSGPSARS